MQFENRHYFIDDYGYYKNAEVGRLHIQKFKSYHKLDIIPEGYVIHHINHTKLDNSESNLMMMLATAHSKYHAKHDWDNRVMTDNVCVSCHNLFEVDNRHPQAKFCSSKCRQAGELKPCPKCGEHMIGEDSSMCRSCGGGFKMKLKDSRACKTCGDSFLAYGSIYCSKKCKDNENRLCEVCDTEFRIAKKYKTLRCVTHRYQIVCKICKKDCYVKNARSAICGSDACRKEVNRLKSRANRAK